MGQSSSKKKQRKEYANAYVEGAWTTQEMLQTFFINLIILNREEVLRSSVEKEVGRPCMGVVQGIAQQAALSYVDDEHLAAIVAAELIKNVPATLEKMGIFANVTQKFNSKGYLVLRVDLTEIDIVPLLKSRDLPSLAEVVESTREWLPGTTHA